jgi:hypothetical protein
MSTTSVRVSTIFAICLGATIAATSKAASIMTVTSTARGTFDVKVTPVTAPDAVPSRMTLEKQFDGDLAGTSRGEMLATGTGAPGSSGGYVAIEKVSGTLAGRAGSFVLQHSATMTRGAAKLTIVVVPDSAVGDLEGLSGTMTIENKGGKHSYEFTYTLK